MGEDEVVRVAEHGAQPPLLELAGEAVRHRHRALRAEIRLALARVLVADPGVAHPHALRLGVDVAPPQPEQLSDTLAGQFDPCYHLACDSYGINGHPDDINNTALGIMSDAVANAVIVFAQTTSATNGTGKASGTSVKAYDWKGDRLVK